MVLPHMHGEGAAWALYPWAQAQSSNAGASAATDWQQAGLAQPLSAPVCSCPSTSKHHTALHPPHPPCPAAPSCTPQPPPLPCSTSSWRCRLPAPTIRAGQGAWRQGRAGGMASGQGRGHGMCWYTRKPPPAGIARCNKTLGDAQHTHACHLRARTSAACFSPSSLATVLYCDCALAEAGSTGACRTAATAGATAVRKQWGQQPRPGPQQSGSSGDSIHSSGHSSQEGGGPSQGTPLEAASIAACVCLGAALATTTRLHARPLAAVAHTRQCRHACCEPAPVTWAATSLARFWASTTQSGFPWVPCRQPGGGGGERGHHLIMSAGLHMRSHMRQSCMHHGQLGIASPLARVY
jgi:hypothetical protein